MLLNFKKKLMIWIKRDAKSFSFLERHLLNLTDIDIISSANLFFKS